MHKLPQSISQPNRLVYKMKWSNESSRYKSN